MSKSIIPVVAVIAAATIPVQAQAASYTKEQLKQMLQAEKENLTYYATPVKSEYEEKALEISAEINALDESSTEADYAKIVTEIQEFAAAAAAADKPYREAYQEATKAKADAKELYTSATSHENEQVESLKLYQKEATSAIVDAYTELSGVCNTNNTYRDDIEQANAITAAAKKFISDFDEIIKKYQDQEAQVEKASAAYQSALLASLEELNASCGEAFETCGTYWLTEEQVESVKESFEQLQEEMGYLFTAIEDAHNPENIAIAFISEKKYNVFKSDITNFTINVKEIAQDALKSATKNAEEYSATELQSAMGLFDFPEKIITEAADDNIKAAMTAANDARAERIKAATDEESENYTTELHNAMAKAIAAAATAYDKAMKDYEVAKCNFEAYDSANKQYKALQKQLNATISQLATDQIEGVIADAIGNLANSELLEISSILTTFNETNEANYNAKKYESGFEDEDYTTLMAKLEGISVESIKAIYDNAKAANDDINEYQSALKNYNSQIEEITSKSYVEQANTLKAELKEQADAVQVEINALTENYKGETTFEKVSDDLKKLETSIAEATKQLNAYTKVADTIAELKAKVTEIKGSIVLDKAYQTANENAYNLLETKKIVCDARTTELNNKEEALNKAFAASPRTCDQVDVNSLAVSVAQLEAEVNTLMKDYWTWKDHQDDIEAWSLAAKHSESTREAIDTAFYEVNSNLNWEEEKTVIYKALYAIADEIAAHESEEHDWDCLSKLKEWNAGLTKLEQDANELVAKIAKHENTNSSYNKGVNDLKNTEVYKELTGEYKKTVDGAIDEELNAITACYVAKSFAEFESNLAAVETLMYNQGILQGVVGTQLYLNTVRETVNANEDLQTEYTKKLLDAIKLGEYAEKAHENGYLKAEYMTVIKAIDQIQLDIVSIFDAAAANAKAYNEMMEANSEALENWASLYSQIGGLYNTKDLADGLALYQGQIKDVYDAVKKQGEEIKEYWNEGKAAEYKIVTTAVDFKKVYDAAAANKQEYVSQIETIIPALTDEDGAYTKALEEIEKLIKDAEPTKQESLAAYVTELETLKAEAIDKLNESALENCNEGKSIEYTPELTAAISEITGAINDIVANANGTYNEEIANYNETVRKAFTAEFEAANTLYNNVILQIAEYGSYKHADYTDEIEAVNKALFSYNKELSNEYKEGLAAFGKVDKEGYIDRDQQHKQHLIALENEIKDIYNEFLAVTEEIAAASYEEKSQVSDENYKLYYTPVTYYGAGREAAMAEFDAIWTLESEIQDRFVIAHEKNTSAQILDGIIADIDKLPALYNAAAVRAAKIEANAHIKTQEEQIAAYKENAAYVVDEETSYDYAGEILEAYTAALAAQTAICTAAKANVAVFAEAKDAKAISAFLKEIKAINVEGALVKAKETADKAVQKNLLDEELQATWEKYDALIAEQYARINDSDTAYEFAEFSDEIMADEIVAMYINYAKRDLDDAVTRNAIFRAANAYADYSASILDPEISEANYFISEALKRAKELQAADAATVVANLLEEAGSLISAYNRAAANNPEANNPEAEKTKEIAAIYDALLEIIDECATNDAEKIAEIAEKKAEYEARLEDIAKRIIAADTETAAYVALLEKYGEISVEELEAQLESNKELEAETKDNKHLTENEEEALNALVEKINTLGENLEDDHAKNLCGKEGAVVTEEKIQALAAEIAALANQFATDTKTIEAQIAAEKKAAEDAAMRETNEEESDIALEALLGIYNDNLWDEAGWAVEYDKLILEECPDVSADYINDIQAVKDAVIEALNTLTAEFYAAQGYNEDLEEVNDPTEFVADKYTELHMSLKAELDRIYTAAKTAQKAYNEAINAMWENYAAMVEAYEEIEVPELIAEEAEILAAQEDIETDMETVADDVVVIEEGDVNWLRPSKSKIAEIEEAIAAVMEKIEAYAELVSAKTYTPGHISDEPGKVVGDDVTTILQLVLNKITDEDMTENMKKAADMDGDGKYTVADLIQINNIYVYGNKEGKSAGEKAPNLNDFYANMGMNIEGADMNVSLDANQKFAALQMDITFPEGVVMDDVAYNGQNNNVVAAANVLADGTTRVLFYSTDGSVINAEEALANIKLAGEGNGFVEINNVVASTTNGTRYNLDGVASSFAIATGIDAAMAGQSNDTIYTISGTLTNALQNGVNIVKSAAGKFMKVLGK